MSDKKRLGEILVQENTVSQDVINDALRVQVGGNRRLGQILLRMGALSEDQLTSTLSQQLHIPLTNPSESFSPEVKKILPRYLCTKYAALPLQLKNNNIILTAMADPSDHEAIEDIEHYTGKVVEPCLSRNSDIIKAIKSNIPYSLKDFFNPQANTKITRITATVALVLTVTLGVATYNYINTTRYGTVSQSNNSTIYEHHDLMVGFDRSNGKISLLGHSAFADGYYSVSFNNINALKSFVNARQKDFSAEQHKWLEWVFNQRLASEPTERKIAKM